MPLQPVIKSIALRPPDRDREVASIQRSIDRHDGQSPRWLVKQWDENISVDSEHGPKSALLSSPPKPLTYSHYILKWMGREEDLIEVVEVESNLCSADP